jgi:hypothetical protein
MDALNLKKNLEGLYNEINFMIPFQTKWYKVHEQHSANVKATTRLNPMTTQIEVWIIEFHSTPIGRAEESGFIFSTSAIPPTPIYFTNQTISVFDYSFLIDNPDWQRSLNTHLESIFYDGLKQLMLNYSFIDEKGRTQKLNNSQLVLGTIQF